MPDTAFSKKLLFLPIILLFLQVASFGRSIPWSYLPYQLGMVFWLGVSALLVAWLVKPGFYPADRIYDFLLTRSALKIWFALNLLFSLFSYFHFKEYGYEFPFLHLGLIMLGLLFVRSGRLYVSFGLSILFLIASIFHFKIHPSRSDMLPVIQIGLDRLKAGMDPYHSFIISGTSVDTMGYLPGTLFMNWPAWALGLDLRWDAVLYRIIWMLLVLREQRLNPQKERLTLLHYFALSPYLNFRHDLYFEGFWVIMVGYFLYPKARSLILAIGICTRQWFWVLAPFLVYREMIQSGKRWPEIIAAHLLSFIGVTFVFYLLLRDHTVWPTFLDSIFWFQHEETFQWDYGVGFARVLYWAGLGHMLQKLQALWCAAVFIAMLVKRPRSEDIWQWGLVAWLGFLLVNGHFWLYFWFSFALFCAVAPYKTSCAKTTTVL